MSDKPTPPGQEVHREKVGSHSPVGRGSRPTGEAIPPTRQWRLQKANYAGVRKPIAQQCYQLLSGHAATGSFLHYRMTGSQRLDSDECLWCNCGKRQSRFHLFTECMAWAPQIRELWRGMGEDCGWEHPRAPALRWLWKDGAVGAVVDFLKSTRVGSRASAEMARLRMGEDRAGQEGPGQGSEEDGPGPP